MNKLCAVGCMVAAAFLGPAVVSSQEAVQSDRSNDITAVDDSPITAEIKSKLAADPLTSKGDIRVVTDNKGVVYLNGSVESQKAVDRAVEIASETKYVTSVDNKLLVEQ